MYRIVDRWASGFALFTLSFVLWLLLMLLCVWIQNFEQTIGPRHGTLPLDPFSGSGALYIDDFYVLARRGEPLIFPMIHADGTLEPEMRVMPHMADVGARYDPVRWLVKGRNLSLPRYRHYETAVGQDEAGGTWLVSPRTGLILLSRKEHLEGSLSDTGWVSGALAKGSAQRATMVSRSATKVTPTFAYLTDEGLYRADLRQRVIRRVAPVSAGAVMYYVSSDPGVDTLVVSGGEVLALSSDLSDIVGAWSVSRVGAAASVPSLASLGDGRFLFREEVAGTRISEGVRYAVSILGRQGEIERRYEYDFRVRGAEKVWRSFEDSFFMFPPAATTHAKSLGVKVASAITPPASRFLSRLQESPEIDMGWRLLGRYAESMNASPYNVGLSLLLAAVLFLRVRRHATAPWQSGLWFVWVAALGVPAVIHYGLLGRSHRLERCPSCGRKKTSALPHCPACRAPAEAPRDLGIEIREGVA